MKNKLFVLLALVSLAPSSLFALNSLQTAGIGSVVGAAMGGLVWKYQHEKWKGRGRDAKTEPKWYQLPSQKSRTRPPVINSACPADLPPHPCSGRQSLGLAWAWGWRGPGDRDSRSRRAAQLGTNGCKRSQGRMCPLSVRIKGDTYR